MAHEKRSGKEHCHDARPGGWATVSSRIGKLGWYWHRLLAMNPEEIGLRVRKKWYARQDGRYAAPRDVTLETRGNFPQLPPKNAAPKELLEALESDAVEILAGRWKFFGHMPLQVDDPPKWQFDYFVGKDFTSAKSGFDLEHRAQPGGADIKVIWEPNRWYQMVRLAMAAWLRADTTAGLKCIAWLKDWCDKNPPFRGLNWTSGLETGIRLMQYTWIDALLEAAGTPAATLHSLREAIIPPHVWYTSRHRSFGSSANNHLLGELAGLILAVARWPAAGKFTNSLEELGRELDREVKLQFAPDGGNLEQALGYHLFSWEFCWQAMIALDQGNAPLSSAARERLQRAGKYYAAVKPCGDVWEYGDSDNAYVTPLFEREGTAAAEWWRWFGDSDTSPALRFWWGSFAKDETPGRTGGWEHFEHAGYAIFRGGEWMLRLDLSPLGYPKMAPHGHLDALHVSIWHRGKPVIIDPGTGTYYAEKEARQQLADWAAHNGPRVKGCDEPKRRGMFLWGNQHAIPRFRDGVAEFSMLGGVFQRRVTFLAEGGFSVEDRYSRDAEINTHWKFPPGSKLSGAGDGYRVETEGYAYVVSFQGWKVEEAHQPAGPAGKVAYRRAELGGADIRAIVSPAFRALTFAPFLELAGSGSAETRRLTIRLDE